MEIQITAEQLKKLYESNLTIKQIAQHLGGVSHMTVYRKLEEAGIERNRNKRKSKVRIVEVDNDKESN